MQETDLSHERAKELMRKLVKSYEGEIAKLRNQVAQQDDRLKGSKDIDALKQDPYYDDIDSVKDSVLDYAREHSLSPREAYGALYGEKKAKETQKKNKKISALSQEGNAADDDFDEGVLSRDEYWTAKKAGISLADYLKFKNR